MKQDGNGEMVKWKLLIAGGGCRRGGMSGSGRQLFSSVSPAVPLGHPAPERLNLHGDGPGTSLNKRDK